MIDLERRDQVFVLRMRRDDNRIDASFLEAFAGALDEVEASRPDAALVTTGESRFYSTGLDVEGLARAGGAEAEGVLRELHRLFARLLAFPMATVAALNGHAFAAGGMLALAQDFRIMRRDRGFLCLPEIDLATGQPLTPGMYALLGARLSQPVLHEALITGRRYGGDEAATRGMVDEALAEGEVLPRAVEIARKLAGKDRATMAALKRGLFASVLEKLGEAAGASQSR